MPDTPNRRGRRNPGLAAELAAAQRVQATQSQQGVQQLPDPDEGYYDEQEQQEGAPHGYEEGEELPVLYPGDDIKVSRSSETQIDGTNHWFGCEARTTVQPHEGEEDAFARVYEVVTTRVEDMIDAAQETVRDGIARRRQEERRRRIEPTR
jgi:membrane carboxypeptidase/penicillin-binding protein